MSHTRGRPDTQTDKQVKNITLPAPSIGWVQAKHNYVKYSKSGSNIQNNNNNNNDRLTAFDPGQPG